MSSTLKTAVVTGANSGIGLATVEQFLQQGWQVIALDLKVDQVQSLPVAAALALDVTADDAPDHVRQAVQAHGGVLHALVNNAGVGGARTLLDTDDTFLDRVLDVNLRSVLRITRAALPLLQAPGGCVVNVSSVYGEVGYPGSAPYAVSKAGVSQFTRQLAADVAAQGIRVNAVAPGVIRTAMTQQRLDNDPAYRAAMLGGTPLGVEGTPHDVASVITFLASDKAAFVTGQVIAVDGGWLSCRSVPSAQKRAD